jgi:hypothetical protein
MQRCNIERARGHTRSPRFSRGLSCRCSHDKMDVPCEQFRPACPLNRTCPHEHDRHSARTALELAIDFLSPRQRTAPRYLLPGSTIG